MPTFIAPILTEPLEAKRDGPTKVREIPPGPVRHVGHIKRGSVARGATREAPASRPFGREIGREVVRCPSNEGCLTGPPDRFGPHGPAHRLPAGARARRF